MNAVESLEIVNIFYRCKQTISRLPLQNTKIRTGNRHVAGQRKNSIAVSSIIVSDVFIVDLIVDFDNTTGVKIRWTSHEV